mgnify:CR=1 FL=1
MSVRLGGFFTLLWFADEGDHFWGDHFHDEKEADVDDASEWNKEKDVFVLKPKEVIGRLFGEVDSRAHDGSGYDDFECIFEVDFEIQIFFGKEECR